MPIRLSPCFASGSFFCAAGFRRLRFTVASGFLSGSRVCSQLAIRAGVGVTVSQRKAVGVAVFAHEGDGGGQHFAAGFFALPLPLPDKQQVAVLDVRHRAILFR
jgi:hypothetical protein